MPPRYDIVTTFCELFAETPPAPLAVSIPGRARAAGLVEIHTTDIRRFTKDKHQKTDDRPFGGGPGMVMLPQPTWDALCAAEALDPRPATRIHLTPQGTPLTQPLVEDLAARERLIILCGHYEGVDERVIQRWKPLEISLGDFVISSGELAAVVLLDAVIRLQPGVLGHDDSAREDSFSPVPTRDPIAREVDPRLLAELGISPDARLLDCPHYTRPRVWEGMEVPPILLSGDHQAVARWRLEQRIQRTRQRRPDLLGPEHP